MSSAAFLWPCYLRHRLTRHEIDFKKFGLLPELFCLGTPSVLQSASQWHGAKCFQCVLLLDGLLETLCCFSFSLSLQEAEWHCDEFTKGACFSRGKSEVSLGAAWAFEVSHCYCFIRPRSLHWENQASFFPNDIGKKILLSIAGTHHEWGSCWLLSSKLNHLCSQYSQLKVNAV